MAGVLNGAESKKQELQKAISLFRVLHRPSPDSPIKISYISAIFLP